MQFELSLLNSEYIHLFKDKIPEGIFIKTPASWTGQKGFGQDVAITILITVTAGIPASFIANWLYDKFKNNPPRKISINRREIQFDKSEITNIIEQSMDIEY